MKYNKSFQHDQQHIDLMTVYQAAEYIDVQPNTLNCWRNTGRYSLPFLKIGRNIRYRQSDLDLWLEARVQANGITGK